MEALACREALCLADDLRINDIQVASDYKGVVEDIKLGTLSCYAPIVKEITRRATCFHSCSYVHESRVHNFEPHDLAKFATSLEMGRDTWLRNPHDTLCVPMNILHE